MSIDIAKYPFGTGKLSTQLNDDIEGDTDIKSDSDRDLVYQACDKVVETLGETETMESLLGDKSKFVNAVDAVVPGDMDPQHRQKIIYRLIHNVEYSIDSLVTELLQTETESDDYEELIAGADPSITDISMKIFDKVNAVSQQLLSAE